MRWIVPRGRDPRLMGHPNHNHQWDVPKLGLFLLTPPWAKGIGISRRALRRPLLLHDQARWARAWVEVEAVARAHKPGLQGPRGVPMPSHLRLSLKISRLFKVHLYYLSYGKSIV